MDRDITPIDGQNFLDEGIAAYDRGDRHLAKILLVIAEEIFKDLGDWFYAQIARDWYSRTAREISTIT